MPCSMYQQECAETCFATRTSRNVQRHALQHVPAGMCRDMLCNTYQLERAETCLAARTSWNVQGNALQHGGCGPEAKVHILEVHLIPAHAYQAYTLPETWRLCSLFKLRFPVPAFYFISSTSKMSLGQHASQISSFTPSMVPSYEGPCACASLCLQGLWRA
eukprot:1158892-Pelagomonas_calceolata.AAC.8